jgi:hypothetical protein
VPQVGFTQKSIGICWKDCGVDASQTYAATWGPLVPVTSSSTAGVVPSCGWYRARLQLVNSSGLAWIGTMNFAYSRTWAETPAPGQVVQVWRYLVNGDLTPTGYRPDAVRHAWLGRGASTAIACASPATSTTRTGAARPSHSARGCLTHACDASTTRPVSCAQVVPSQPLLLSFIGPALGFVIGAGSTLEAGEPGLECLRRWDATAACRGARARSR